MTRNDFMHPILSLFEGDEASALSPLIYGKMGTRRQRMEIIEKNVNDIIPYVNNPRNNDGAVDYVAASIAEFGFKVPIVLDKKNVIVAGHTRLKAAQKLGLKTVPCIVADDLTDAQIKAFRLADNSVAEVSFWDNEKLTIELEDLQDFDMSLFGLDDFDGITDAFALMDDVGYDAEPKESTIFSILFNISKEYEETVMGYVKEHGKDELADMIVKKCQEG